MHCEVMTAQPTNRMAFRMVFWLFILQYILSKPPGACNAKGARFLSASGSSPLSCVALVGRDALIAPHFPLSCHNRQYSAQNAQSAKGLTPFLCISMLVSRSFRIIRNFRSFRQTIGRKPQQAPFSRYLRIIGDNSAKTSSRESAPFTPGSRRLLPPGVEALYSRG